MFGVFTLGVERLAFDPGKGRLVFEQADEAPLFRFLSCVTHGETLLCKDSTFSRPSSSIKVCICSRRFSSDIKIVLNAFCVLLTDFQLGGNMKLTRVSSNWN